MLSFMAVGLLLAACGSGGADKVEQKIKNGEQLTESDYTVIIKYCGEFAEEAQKIQDEINDIPAEAAGQTELEEKMATLAEKYPYTVEFSEKITNSTKEEIGEKNVALVNKYAPLMWFSAPDWADIGSAVNVDGFIEDMPTTDTSGVISTGDGVEVGG